MPDPIVSVGMTLAEAERRLIKATVGHFNGDKRRAALELGIALKTLYNKLNRYKQDEAANESR